MERILILDDDRFFGNELAEILSNNRGGHRYSVDAIDDVNEAFFHAQKAVRNGEPYDVFLIDQRLGIKLNGIEVMQSLKKISPESDSIIFTGWGNPGDGVRAYQAGAYQHLLKPFDPEELFHILEALGSWRKLHREHRWFQTNTEILEKVLSSASYEQAAQVIAKGVLKLGVEQALFFKYSLTEEDQLIGVCQAGDNELAEFEDQSYPIKDLPFLQGVVDSEKIIYFNSKEIDTDVFMKSLSDPKSSLQRKWAAAPMWFEKNLVGLMLLRFSPISAPHTQDDRKRLQDFIRLAAFNLERVRRYEETKRKDNLRMKAAFRIIDAIGTISDLREILERVIIVIKDAFIDAVPGVLLFNEMDKLLEFASSSLEYYRIESQEHKNLSAVRLDGQSIACRVARNSIEQQEIVLENIPDVDKDPDYLELIHSTQSELCVSLFLDKKLLGVLVLERDRKHGFGTQDEELATAIAGQMSLAISRTQERSRLNFMHSVSTATAWAADFAHDLNRDIGIIRNYSYLIDEDSLTPEQRNYLAKIKKSAENLASTIPIYAEEKTFQVDEFIRKWVPEIAEHRKEKMDVVFDLGCDEVEIQCNPVLLQRILRHLIRNAANAMKNETTRRLLVQTVLLENEMIQIVFQDSGPGIKEELRPIILEQPITREVGHGGYGLLVTRLMVESIGGEIRLLPSQPEEGAIFSIKIPLKHLKQLSEEANDD